MRTPSLKMVWPFLLVLSVAWLVFLAQARIKKPARETNASEAAEADEGRFLFEAEEISISEDKIYIRTKEGKELTVGPGGKILIPTGKGKKQILWKEGPAEEIIVEEGKIKIGDKEINLRELEGLEILDSLKALNLEVLDKISPIRIPKVKVSPRLSTTTEDIVKFGKDVVVEEDEEIDGDVVAVGGSIQIKGTVTGDVVAIGGDVEVFDTGVVEGDAVSIGGDVIRRKDGEIHGEKVSVGFLGGRSIRYPPWFAPFKFPFGSTFFGFAHFQPPALSFFLRILRVAFVLFVGIVVISVFPKHVEKVKEKTKHEFLKSGLVGLVAQILALPIFILLIITVIGIPVALLVEPLLILAALILGFTGVSLFIGEKLQEHTSMRSDTKIMTLVMGILAVEVVPLSAWVMRVFGDIFSLFAWIFTFLGILIVYMVVTVGLGASILTRLGTRPKEIKTATVAANTTGDDSKK